jgi:hypothetical protein
MSASSGSDLLLSIALLAAAIVLLVMITPSPVQKAAWQQREVAAPASEVITAAITYVQDLGYAIDTIDRESGLVKTQYAGRGQLYGAAGVIGNILAGEARYAVTILVTPLSASSSRVRVNLIAENWNQGSIFVTGHWAEAPSMNGQREYAAFFSGLLRTLGITAAEAANLASRPMGEMAYFGATG